MAKAKKRAYIRTNDDGTVQIWLNGKDVSDTVLKADLSFQPQGIFLTIEYGCWEQLTFEGEVEIHHVCPYGAHRPKKKSNA